MAQYVYNTKVQVRGRYVEVLRYKYQGKSAYISRGHTVSRRKFYDDGPYERRQDSIERARRALVRKVVANSADIRPLFLTLTFAEGVQDREFAQRELQRFVREMRDIRPGMKYIYVLERHESGDWHAHMLIFDIQFIDYDTLMILWGNGGIYIEKANNTKHVGFYLGKYIGKQDEWNHKRLFNASLNLDNGTDYYLLLQEDHDIAKHWGKADWSGGYITRSSLFIEHHIFYEDTCILSKIRGVPVHV